MSKDEKKAGEIVSVVTHDILELLKNGVSLFEALPLKSMENFKKVKKGDHLVYETELGWRVHFYVMANNNNGSIDVKSFFLPNSGDFFIESKLFKEPKEIQNMKLEIKTIREADIRIQSMSKWTYDQSTDLSEEAKRIKEFAAKHQEYGLFENNSEHFVSFVKTGHAVCHQFTYFKDMIIKQVLVLGGRYGISSTVLAASKLGVLPVIAAIIEGITGGVINKIVTSTVSEVAHKELQQLLASISQVGAKQVAEELSEEIIENLVKNIAKSISEHTSRRLIKESVEVLGKEVAEKAVNQIAKEVSKNGARKVGEEILKAGIQQFTKRIAVNAMKDVTKEAAERGLQQSLERVMTNLVKWIGGEQTAENAVRKAIGSSAAKQVAKNAAGEVLEEVENVIARQLIKNALKENAVAVVLVEGIFYCVGEVEALYKLYEGKIDGTEFRRYTVDNTFAAAGGIAGGLAGAAGGTAAGVAVGAAIGSIVPVVGNIVGAAVGGVVGGVVGGIGGGVGGGLAGVGVGKLVNKVWDKIKS